MEKKIIVTKQVAIILPSRPNFIKIGGGLVNTADIDETTLREIGREWVEELVKGSKLKRGFKK